MDTATSEYGVAIILSSICISVDSFTFLDIDIFSYMISRYLFCDDFFGEESIFYEIFAGNSCIFFSPVVCVTDQYSTASYLVAFYS